MKSSIWYQRYKPQAVQDVILPQALKDNLLKYMKDKDIPSLGLFSSSPGTGKSALSHAIITEMNSEALWINASLERGIDTLRGKIKKFASSSSFDDELKVVVLDECLEENEKVRIGTVENWKGVPLNELVPGLIYPCVSFNQETGQLENDTCEIISDKEDIIYEVALSTGEVVKVTDNHPFIIEVDGKFIEKTIAEGLNENDKVVCIK